MLFEISLNIIGTEVVGVLDSSRTGTPSIYHSQCEVLVDCFQERCGHCVKHRKILTAMISRASRALQNDGRTCPSSHTTYLCLSSDEKSERLRRLHKKTRIGQQQIKRLQGALADTTGTDGVDLDEAFHDDFTQLIKDHSKDVESTFEEGTFQRLFWSQQQTASSLKNSKSMRWHPLIIKWCLYLRHLSGKAYELLRSSGCIKLPSHINSL